MFRDHQLIPIRGLHSSCRRLNSNRRSKRQQTGSQEPGQLPKCRGTYCSHEASNSKSSRELTLESEFSAISNLSISALNAGLSSPTSLSCLIKSFNLISLLNESRIFPFLEFAHDYAGTVGLNLMP